MFLPGEERDAAQILSDALARDGVEIHLNTTAVAVRREGANKVVDLVSDDNKISVSVDEIVTGIGRAPNVENIDMEMAGVQYDTDSGILVNDYLQTTNRRIYAAGDVCLTHKFTHTADASARIVVQNALFLGRQRLSALTIPWCTYTYPEIAHVGLYIREAREKGIPVKTFTALMHDVDRAITDGEDEGFGKNTRTRRHGSNPRRYHCREARRRNDQWTLARHHFWNRTARPGTGHPCLPDASRGDQDGRGRVLSHAPDARSQISGEALAGTITVGKGQEEAGASSAR